MDDTAQEPTLRSGCRTPPRSSGAGAPGVPPGARWTDGSGWGGTGRMTWGPLLVGLGDGRVRRGAVHGGQREAVERRRGRRHRVALRERDHRGQLGLAQDDMAYDPLGGAAVVAGAEALPERRAQLGGAGAAPVAGGEDVGQFVLAVRD